MDEEYKKAVRALDEINEYLRPFDKSVFDWRNGEHRPLPPKSELPECIKKRVRWVQDRCMGGESDLTFIDCLTIAAPDVKKRKRLAKEYSSYWQPIDDDYKQFWAQFYKKFGTEGECLVEIVQEAVAAALLYGLREDDDDDGQNVGLFTLFEKMVYSH